MPNLEPFYSENYFSSFPDPLISQKLLRFSTYPAEEAQRLEIEKGIVESLYQYSQGESPAYYSGTPEIEAFNSFKATAAGKKTLSKIEAELKQCFDTWKTWCSEQHIILAAGQTGREAVDQFYAYYQQEPQIFDPTRPELYSSGKKAIETIALLIKDETIPLAARTSQMVSLLTENNLLMCAHGCISRITSTSEQLRYYKMGGEGVTFIQHFLIQTAKDISQRTPYGRTDSFNKLLCRAANVPSMNPELIQGICRVI
jgi:hypothetical protein